MITPTDIGGDENTARRVLVRARDIAPCIDSFEDGSEEKKNAIAILKGVLAEMPGAGQRRVRTMSRNGTSLAFEAGSAFTDEDVSGLRALCGMASVSGGPVGSFPPAGVVSRQWPEGR